jgi:diadenylate cyclase
VRFTDVVDVAIVALLLWALIVWLRTARARLALLGLCIVGALYAAARVSELQLTVRLLEGFFAAVVLVMVVVFQDDLRRLFERIAVASLGARRPRPGPESIDTLMRVVERLARQRVGALIVLPGRDPLARHLDGGVHLRGRLSDALLESLFDPHSAGHDGAVIVSGNEVSRFGVHLPLATDAAVLGAGGTRHAAALGLAERSDALCIVVSEERGTVSLAQAGALRTLPDPAALEAALRAFLRRLHPARRDTPLVAFTRALPAYWREAALAVALSLALWATLGQDDAQVRVGFAVPVEVANLPEGWALDGVDPPEVEVTLEGSRSSLHLATPDRVQLEVDAPAVELGRRTFELSPAQVEHPGSLRVASISPSRVVLRVSRQ